MFKNRLLLYGSLLMVLLSFLSCKPEPIVPEQEEPEPEKPELRLDAQPLTVGVKGKNFIFELYCNRDVTVESSADWCGYSLMHDAAVNPAGSLKIIVEENKSADVRTATVTVSAEECEPVTIEVTQDHRILATDKEMTSFSLKKSKNSGLANDIAFKYDEQTRTFSAMYLKWIDGDEPEMLVPTFETDGESVQVNGMDVVSEKTAISFAEDFTVTVVAEDGSTADYNIIFNCPQINTELPVLHMKPDYLISSKDNYVDTYIQLYDKTDESTGEGWWDSAEKGKIEMRGRGNSTWGLPKKPFRMKFTEKFSPIGLNHAKEKSWVILAQDMDKSLLRTHLAFEYSRILFNAADNYHHEKAVLFTPCSRFINVYLTGDYYDSSTGRTRYMDGEYLGVYQMSDQVQRADGRIAVDKLKASDGADPEKITGGYVIEADLHEGNHYTSKGIKLTYKYPEDDDFDQAQYDYITDFINQAEAALYGSNYKDPENGWRKYFDEKTLADFIIVKEFVGDLDGYTSTYMYKRRGYDKLFFGPIWDCDKGWNNDKRVPHYEYQPLESLMIYAGFWMPPYVNNDWFHRLWTDETFRAFVAKRWADKKEELKAVTSKVLAEVPADMAKAIEANFEVWPFYYQYSGEANMPAKDYPSEIQRIAKLSSEREALLDRLFNE
ncbi:MAG: CotH kinase family protein [Bacteroidales bacterium]|nr:CotH kinase family protein [Bacteroidales bacterium]